MLSLQVADSLHGVGELEHSTGPISPATLGQARLSALRAAHDDLDDAIDALGGAHGPDDLIIARLKKRRLQIRDEIASIGAADIAVPEPQSALHDEPQALIGAAPKPIQGSSVFGVLAALFFLLILGLSWPELEDSLNQTIAQIYLLNLLVAANG
jgi:hypothetical protein